MWMGSFINAAVNKNNNYYCVFLKRETINLELKIYSGCPGQSRIFRVSTSIKWFAGIRGINFSFKTNKQTNK